jgi:hypothetical protein
MSWPAFATTTKMAARFLAMFAKLGTTETGSRALGQTLIDFFALGQEAVAKQYADTTNEHVIEDIIDVNYGIDESAPLLKFSDRDRLGATPWRISRR